MDRHDIELERWKARLDRKRRRAYFFDLLADEHGPEVTGRAMRGVNTEIVDDMLESMCAALDEDRPIPEIDPDELAGVAEWVPNVGLVGHWSPGRPALGIFYGESLCETAGGGYVNEHWTPVPAPVHGRARRGALASRQEPTTGPSAIPRRADPRLHPVLLILGAMVGFAFSMSMIAVAMAVMSGKLHLPVKAPEVQPAPRLVGPTAYARAE